jgi:hypothetical protein
VASVAHLAPTHLGLDVHKDTISVAILAHDRDGPDVERITHDEASVRRLTAEIAAAPGLVGLLVKTAQRCPRSSRKCRMAA